MIIVLQFPKCFLFFFFLVYIFLLIMCMYVYLPECLPGHRLWDLLELEFRGGCELPDVDTGNQVWVLCRIRALLIPEPLAISPASTFLSFSFIIF